MNLRSRYRLMRLRSRTGGGRLRRWMSQVLLVTVAACVLVTGLIAAVALVFGAAIFVGVFYIWSRLRRRGSRPRPRSGSGGGITLDGEYTVESEETDRKHPES